MICDVHEFVHVNMNPNCYEINGLHGQMMTHELFIKQMACHLDANYISHFLFAHSSTRFLNHELTNNNSQMLLVTLRKFNMSQIPILRVTANPNFSKMQ